MNKIERELSGKPLEKVGKIQTASIIVGNKACDACCPFCISKMTPNLDLSPKEPIRMDRFDRFMQYSKQGEAKTAMLTGKGEPTLFAADITNYLERIAYDEKAFGFRFAAKELQTNGIALGENGKKFNPLLREWKELGLTTISISIVNFDPEENRKNYLPNRSKYTDLPKLIENIHKLGMRVRFSCVMFDGGIDSSAKLKKLIEFAAANNVEELTVRPVNKPDSSRDDNVNRWIMQNYLKPEQYKDIAAYLLKHGVKMGSLPFGAVIYDVNGQNVCITNSLTKDSDKNYSRQLIFAGNGKIVTDWTENARELE